MAILPHRSVSLLYPSRLKKKENKSVPSEFISHVSPRLERYRGKKWGYRKSELRDEGRCCYKEEVGQKLKSWQRLLARLCHAADSAHFGGLLLGKITV